MELVWQKDAQGCWTADYRGSTLSVIQLAGVWRWEAVVNGVRIRQGAEASYHLAKAVAMSAAMSIAEEGAD
ncbi:MAG: hypothetical protein WCJ64_05655 [Rhodospirillaceae bacterium]